MKIEKLILLVNYSFFILTVFLAACSKENAPTNNNQSLGLRTTNMFGFPLINTGCKLSKVYDSTTGIIQIVYIFDSTGNLKSEISGIDSVNYYYDSTLRLVKIIDKDSDEEWKINYPANSIKANRIDFKDLVSSYTFSINISYPAANKVVLSTITVSLTVYDTIYFDANYNPVKAVYREISNSSGSTLHYTETNTQFSATILNPFYPWAKSEFGVFSFWGALYEGANLICGKNIGINETHQDFTYPLNGHIINFLPHNINSKSYPIYLRDNFNSFTYKFDYLF